MIYMKSNINNNILETKWNSSLFFQWINNLYSLIKQNKEILDHLEQNNELSILKVNIYKTITEENLNTLNWKYDLFNGKDVTISAIPYVGIYTDNNTQYFDLFINWKIIYFIDEFVSDLLNNFSQDEICNINSKIDIVFNVELDTGKVNFKYNYNS